MNVIPTYDAYNARFHFQPPIEVGDHLVDSLAKLVTIAVMGAATPAETIERVESNAQLNLKSLTDAVDVHSFLSTILAGMHTVTMTRP